MNAHGTGVFTSRVNGTFYFTWTVAIGNNQELVVQLIKNGDVVGQSVVSKSPGNFGTGTGSAVIHMDPYDDVWLRVADPPMGTFANYTSTTNADIQSRLTTFAGFRVA